MSNVSDIYDLWLKPWHLPPGKLVQVTIEKIERRILQTRPTEKKPALVLSFVGKNRRLILNAGNANKMADLGGEDYTAWTGLVIGLQRAEYTSATETIHIVPAPPTNGNNGS